MKKFVMIVIVIFVFGFLEVNAQLVFPNTESLRVQRSEVGFENSIVVLNKVFKQQRKNYKTTRSQSDADYYMDFFEVSINKEKIGEQVSTKNIVANVLGGVADRYAYKIRNNDLRSGVYQARDYSRNAAKPKEIDVYKISFKVRFYEKLQRNAAKPKDGKYEWIGKDGKLLIGENIGEIDEQLTPAAVINRYLQKQCFANAYQQQECLGFSDEQFKTLPADYIIPQLLLQIGAIKVLGGNK